MSEVAHTEHRTASRLWVAAAGIVPGADLPAWSGPRTACVMCGSPVLPGDRALAADSAAAASFNGKLDCKYPGQAVCDCCAAVWEPRWMAKFMDSKAVAIAGRGVFTLRSKDDVAAFVLQPIESPYVAIWNTRQQAHMIWRTPVSIPCERFREVRLDDEVLLIDRHRVMQAARSWTRAHDILESLGKPRISLFELVWDLGSTKAGQPRDRLVAAVQAHGDEGAAAVDALLQLPLADWWALLAIRDVPMDNPGAWPTLARVAP